MSQLAQSCSPDKLTWAVTEKGALVISNVWLSNRKCYHVIIDKDKPVPDGFEFESDSLLELRDRCAQIGNQLIRAVSDPVPYAICSAEEGTSIFFETTLLQNIPQNTQLHCDCRRICAITEPVWLTICAKGILRVPRDPTFRMPSPVCSPAPLVGHQRQLQQAQDILRMQKFLDPMKHPNGSSFREVRADPNHVLREDLKKLNDASAQATKKWIEELEKCLYDKFFIKGSDKDRKERSRLWVMTLLNPSVSQEARQSDSCLVM
jgi:hypothetical protein